MAINQPEYKSFIKLGGGSETERCFYPLKVDTYGRGCVSDCTYCYAKSVLDFRKLWDAENPAVSDYGKIEKIFGDVFDKGKETKWSELLKQKMPVRIGGMTDCFGTPERKHQVTLRFLQLLKRYEYPYQIFTKNALVAEEPWLTALDKDLAYVQFSITTPYDDVCTVHEEGASVTSERLKAMGVLSRRGFYLAGRINPLFPIYPDGYYSGTRKFLLEDPKPLRYFDWSLVDMLAAHGCNTVIAGFVRLSPWNIKWMKEKTGEDFTYLFAPTAKHDNQALHFSTEEKRYYYEKMQKQSHELGMAFSVCYDGDDAYHSFQYLWENQNDCCNAKGHIPGFKVAYDFFNGDFGKKDAK